MVNQRVRRSRDWREAKAEIPWTVARCNRLIRSISSRIATIRRIVETFDNKAAGSLNASAPVSGQARSPATRLPSTKHSNGILPYLQSPQYDDPEWMPQVNKPNSRTYGGKCQPRNARAKPVDESAFTNAARRTPFWRKLFHPEPDDSPLAQPALRAIAKTASESRLSKKSRQLPVKPTTSLGEAHQHLVNAFSSFLKNTSPSQVPARKGARKLHEMCLRHVPLHIEVEQAWLDKEDEDADVDATDEVYTFLESLGQGDVSGFAGLQQVVRAHGIHLITRAIGDGLLRDTIIQQLIEGCREHRAIAEGQTVLRVWAQEVLFAESSRPLRSLKLLIDAACELDSPDFLFRQLAHLVESGKVAHSQFTGFGQVWSLLLRSLAAPEGHLDAMQLLEMCASAHDEEPSQHAGGSWDRHSLLWSVAVLVTAISWKQEQECGGFLSYGSLKWQLDRLLYSVHAVSGDIPAATARPFILSSLLATATTSCRIPNAMFIETGAHDLALLHRERPTGCNEDVDFLIEVAKVISHVDANMAFEMMKGTVLGLAQMASKLSDSQTVRYLRGLAVDGAMTWAEMRNDVESYDWAEDIEDLFWMGDAQLQGMQTPASCKPFKYVWDAGISEWVQATPFHGVKRRSASSSEVDETLEDSGICMLTNRGPSRKRSRSPSGSDEDSDLEDRDELSMQTPELVRLRDQRARKARRVLPADCGRENVRPTKKTRNIILQKRGPPEVEDMSEDELGL